MEIRDIRTRIGLTQKAFAEKYHIPLQTLKQWESNPQSTSYRQPPDYVVYMLERLAAADYGVSFGAMTRAENLAAAAKHSRGYIRQWFRYLRKEFNGTELRLTEDQVKEVLESEDLSMVQKVIFKRAVTEGTATNRYVVALNSRAKTPMLDELIRRKHHE